MNNLKNEFVDKDVIVIDNTVYDVTKFLHEHPGGKEVIEEHLFRDASSAFNDIGHSDNAKSLLQKYEVGSISNIDNRPGSNQVSSYYPYATVNPLFNANMDTDVDSGYTSKNESCSGFGRDCEQIKKNVVIISTGFLGLVLAIVLYFITQDGFASLFISLIIGMSFFFSQYDYPTDESCELTKEIFFY
jgi:hypothetical protein